MTLMTFCFQEDTAVTPQQVMAVKTRALDCRPHTSGTTCSKSLLSIPRLHDGISRPPNLHSGGEHN